MMPVHLDAPFEKFPFPGVPAQFIFKSKNFQFPINERPYYHSFKFISTIAHSLFQQFILFEHQNKSTSLLAYFNKDNPKIEAYFNHHNLSSEKYQTIKDGYIMTTDNLDTRILFKILSKNNFLSSRYLEKLDNIITNSESVQIDSDDSNSKFIFRPKKIKNSYLQIACRL